MYLCHMNCDFSDMAAFVFLQFMILFKFTNRCNDGFLCELSEIVLGLFYSWIDGNH